MVVQQTIAQRRPPNSFLLVAHHFLHLGVSKSHSYLNPQIWKSLPQIQRFPALDPNGKRDRHCRSSGGCACFTCFHGCLPASCSLSFFCHQGLWLKAGRLLGHQTLSIQFMPVVGGEEGPKPPGRWSVQCMRSACHWLRSEGLRRKRLCFLPLMLFWLKGGNPHWETGEKKDSEWK